MTGEKNRFKTSEKLWDLDDKQLKTPMHDAMVLWLMDEKNAKKILEPLTNYRKCCDFMNSYELHICSFDIYSEVPLKASNGFINGYADLLICRDEIIRNKYYECNVSEKVLSKIKEAKTVGDLMDIMIQHYHITNFEPKLNKDEYDTRYGQDFKKLGYHSYYDEFEHLNDKLYDFISNVSSIPPEMHRSELEKWVTDNNYYKYTHNDIICLIEVKPYIDSFGAVLRQINSYKSFWGAGNDYCKRFVCLFTFDDRFDAQFESQGITVLHPPISKDEMLDMFGLR